MICETCGREHVSGSRGRPCKGHRIRDEDGNRIDPVPCRGNARKGQNICNAHGGKARQNVLAGERRELARKATEMMDSFGAPVQVDLAEELLDLICHTAGYVRFLRGRVDQLHRDDMIFGLTRQTEGDIAVGNGPTARLQRGEHTTREAGPHVWIQMLSDWSDKHARLIVEALKLGLDERRVRIAEQQGEKLFRVLLSVLADLGHDIRDPDTAAIVERHLVLVRGAA